MESGRTTYILRVWYDPARVVPTPNAPPPGRLSCSLQLPSTEETHYFASLEEAFEFIQTRGRQSRPRE
jgi:hypothetical protein